MLLSDPRIKITVNFSQLESIKGQYFSIPHIHTIKAQCNTHLARYYSVDSEGPPKGSCAKGVMVLGRWENF